MDKYIAPAAAITALVTLFTMSELFAPIRAKLPARPFGCPICATYWIAMPCLYFGPIYYLAMVTFSIVGVFIVTKTYNELADMNYEENSTN